MSKNLVKNLELLQSDNTIVLFAWSIFRTSVEDTEDALNYCSTVISELVTTRNVFGALYDLITHPIFRVSY